MKTIIFAIALSVVSMSCTSLGRYSFENHYVSMDDQIDDEHVKYKNGSLYIDEEKVELPKGNNLSVKYKNKKGSISYIVEVDGKLVASVEISSET